MDQFIVKGGRKLGGEIVPSGNKNEALPAMASILLSEDPVTIHNLPNIGDISAMRTILEGLGVSISFKGDSSYQFDASQLISHKPDQKLSGQIRASFLLISPLLHRFRKVKIYNPGGDSIGRRRLDTHILAMKQMGVEFYQEDDFYIAKAKEIIGVNILLDEASVLATENVVMAAVLATGTTTIYNAACEPHVQGLCRMLNRMGAKIKGLGSNKLVIKGVKGGIEKFSKIMMPILLVIIIILVIRGLTLPGAEKGVKFLFLPDFSKLSGNTILVALGHAFFTLSLGMGTMLTYGSYLSRKDNIVSSAIIVVFLDTAIALLAGIAIFTAVFSQGLVPDQGPALIFHVLPTVFPKIPGGYIFGIMFFFLLMIAALTSGISLLEVVIAYFVDEKGWSRRKATLVFGGTIFVIGVPSALSSGPLADVKIFFGMTFFDLMDYMSFKYMLPLGGFLMTIFVAYHWGAKEFIAEIKSGCPRFNIKPLAATILITISGILILVTLVTGILGLGE